MRELISGVYQILNLVNGKRYIGSSKDILKRKGEHYNLLRRGKHENNHLQNACNKFGIENLSFCILEECEGSKEILLIREQHYLDVFKPEYNLNPLAHSCLGVKHTEETRRNVSRAAQNRPPVRNETREKHSVSMKGNKRLSGYVPSEETREKLSASLVGNTRAEGHHWTLSEETRARMRKPKGPQTKKRAPISEETREKISARKREWWANKKQEHANSVIERSAPLGNGALQSFKG